MSLCLSFKGRKLDLNRLSRSSGTGEEVTGCGRKLHSKDLNNYYCLSALRRHFGKQMNKETKLRIHNITAKAALKFGSEAWVLRKREE